MRTLRLAVTGTMVLALLGGMGGAVVAQTESDAPGFGDSVALSFTADHGWSVNSPAIGFEEDRTTYRDQLVDVPINSGDPRLDGNGWAIYNYDVFLDTGLYVSSGVVGIDNEDGSWRGTTRGYSTAGEVRQYMLWDLTGEGAYEGLSARMYRVPIGDDGIFEGIIFEGEPPPFPDLPAEESIAAPVEPVLLQLTFDGESCTYEGPTELSPGPVELRFRNESDGAAATNMMRINEGHTIQDVINYTAPEPTSKHAPAWTRGLGTWRPIEPGDGQQWERNLKTGLYFMVCARWSPLAVWGGTGLTVSD